MKKFGFERLTAQELVFHYNVEVTLEPLEFTASNYMRIINHPLNKQLFFIEKDNCSEAKKLFLKKHQHNLEDDIFSDRLLFIHMDLRTESQSRGFIGSYLEEILGEK